MDRMVCGSYARAILDLEGRLSVMGGTLTMGLHYWGTSGLETPLYTLLLINVPPLRSPETQVQWGIMVSLALLGICGPEAPAIVWCWR